MTLRPKVRRKENWKIVQVNRTERRWNFTFGKWEYYALVTYKVDGEVRGTHVLADSPEKLNEKVGKLEEALKNV